MNYLPEWVKQTTYYPSRVVRERFTITDPHTGKPVQVVYATFAACLERQVNELREKVK